MDKYQKHAEERQAMHEASGRRDYKPLSKNHEYVGLMAEKAFTDAFGGEVDVRLLSQGDKGHDFTLSDGTTVDVKGARRAHRLLVKAGKKKYADIFVLAQYDDSTQTATLVGWTTKENVLEKEPRDSGFGIVNHEVPAKELYPMWVLRRWHEGRLVRMSYDENGKIRYHKG